MDRLELDVGRSGAHQHGQTVAAAMQKTFERAHAVCYDGRWWRNECPDCLATRLVNAYRPVGPRFIGFQNLEKLA